MQKKDFINLMAETQKITKTKASESLEIVLADLTNSLTVRNLSS